MKRQMFVLLMVAALIAGCSAVQAQGGPTAQDIVEPQTTANAHLVNTDVPEGKTPTNGVIVVFERSGGLAGISEKFTFYADGRLELIDGSFQQLDASKVLSLARDIEGLGFFDLKDAYGVFSQCNDCFTYSLTVTSGERTKTITTKDGVTDVPQEFWTAVEKINALLPAK